MSEEIVSQNNKEVKQECELEWCHEEIFREGLCWEHFCEEKIKEWDARDAERQTALEGVGYIFGDPIDRGWFGYKPEEVLA